MYSHLVKGTFCDYILFFETLHTGKKKIIYSHKSALKRLEI